MNIIYSILYVVLIVILFVITLFFIYFFVKTSYIFCKNRCKTKHKKKFLIKHKLYHLRESRYINSIEFVKQVILDFLHGKDYLRLYGIWAFTGYYGEGKTMGCLQFAKNLQRKYPNRNIKIYSNINIVGQTWVSETQKRIEDWNELLNLPKNSIFIYDESQSDFSCNMGVNSFPEDLLRRLTQVRKKQFAVFCTSPRYNRLNINMRESINFVIECKNILKLDRWFRYTFYHADDYEQYRESKLKLMMNKYLTMSFVVQNKDYRQYNTIEEVETIKKEDVKLKKDDKILLQVELKRFRNEIMKEMDIKLKKVI